MRVLLAALALLIFPASALADEPGSETMTHGDVTATLSWQGNEPGVSNARLAITRAGVPAFDAPVPEVLCEHCTPEAGPSVVDLEGDGDLEVYITANTGGLNCCRRIGFYSYNPDRHVYEELTHDFGPNGFEFVDIDGDGDTEIVSQDGRFDQLFTAHVYSERPPQVFTFLHQDGVPVMVETTTGYPDPIMVSAARALRALRHRNFEGGLGHARAYMATYVADQYLLGKRGTGRRELDRQIRRGVLGRPASAQAFKRRLFRLLHSFGYA